MDALLRQTWSDDLQGHGRSSCGNLSTELFEAWGERVAIVRFCSGREMTDQQAQRIVQRQMGLSDDDAAQMAAMDKQEVETWTT